jgi:hypothetical protein
LATADLAFLADDDREPLELLGHLLLEDDDLVEQLGDLAVSAGQVLGQAHGEVAAAQAAQRADKLPAVQEIAGGKVVHSSLLRAAPPLEFGCNSTPRQTLSKSV